MKHISNIFSKKEQSKPISVETARPFFNRLGVNIYTIGFPNLLCADPRVPALSEYSVHFENVKAELTLDNENLPLTVISGDYISQAKCSFKQTGILQPVNPLNYKFKIQKGQLNVELKK